MSQPLERVSIDLIDMVAGTQGYHYRRYTKLIPLKSKTTEEVKEAFHSYLSDFGTPRALLLDNGGEFTSHLFKNYCHSRGITLCYYTPYHPQGNSSSERMHRTLKGILATLSGAPTEVAEVPLGMPHSPERGHTHYNWRTTIFCILWAPPSPCGRNPSALN